MATATWTCLWVSTPTMIFPQAGGRVKLVIAVCLLHRRTVGSAGREGGQDCDGRLTQAPIRSLPTRPVGHMDSRPAVPTDQRQGIEASRRARVRHRPGDPHSISQSKLSPRDPTEDTAPFSASRSV